MFHRHVNRPFPLSFSRWTWGGRGGGGGGEGERTGTEDSEWGEVVAAPFSLGLG